MLAICLSMLEDPDDALKFNEVHARYHSKMFHIAFGITGNEYDSKEVIQNSFVNLALAFHRVSDWDMKSIESYLYKIVTNEALKLVGHRNNSAIHLDVDLYDYFETEETPETILVNKEAYTKVVNCIKSLPITYRDILNMYFVGELKPKMIASVMDKPLNTVKCTIKRGKKLLKELLKEERIK